MNGYSEQQLLDIAQRVGACLLRRSMMLATAESCTGGWVAQTVTSLAGSSAWFDRGFVTYSNQSKQDMLGVSEETLATHGAVSGEVVRVMAQGALLHSQAQVSVAISGVAGPGGGSVEKPVGTVWIAWAVRDGSCREQRFHFDGDRREVRAQAVYQALLGVLELVG